VTNKPSKSARHTFLMMVLASVLLFFGPPPAVAAPHPLLPLPSAVAGPAREEEGEGRAQEPDAE